MNPPEPVLCPSSELAQMLENLRRSRIRRLLGELNANSQERQRIKEELKSLGHEVKEDRTRTS